MSHINDFGRSADVETALESPCPFVRHELLAELARETERVITALRNTLATTDAKHRDADADMRRYAIGMENALRRCDAYERGAAQNRETRERLTKRVADLERKLARVRRERVPL